MKIPTLDLAAQWRVVGDDVHAAIGRVLASGSFILGQEGTLLEREIAEREGAVRAVAVSSGTDAILATLLALGIGPGDEVVTSPFTFIATGSAVARVGARVVLTDIDPDTFNVAPRGLPEAIGSKTRAVIPVHLFGQMADMGAIQREADPRGVAVVEDAAQAIGARWGDRPIGRGSRAATLSFFPSKNLGAIGDAGMVLTDDESLAERLVMLRNHGQKQKHVSEITGANLRMDEVQAAALRAKLPYLDDWTAARRSVADRYHSLFAAARIDPELLTLPREADGALHVYHQFVVRSTRRDALREHLAARGIATAVYYPVPLHLQPCFAALGYGPGDFPESERAARECLALPIYPELHDEAVCYVVAEVASFFAGGA